MTRVYVSIGSNVEREKNVRAAVAALRTRYSELAISPVYSSAAVGFHGDDFYNLVVGFDTEEALGALAAALSELEHRHGRRRGARRFAPRTLDLDILTFGDAIVDTPERRLPRDEITRYAFVLKPLADLAPDERHPTLDETYRSLWQRFDPSDQPLTRVSFEFE